jgi:hypothetical protein
MAPVKKIWIYIARAFIFASVALNFILVFKVMDGAMAMDDMKSESSHRAEVLGEAREAMIYRWQNAAEAEVEGYAEQVKSRHGIVKKSANGYEIEDLVFIINNGRAADVRFINNYEVKQ